MARASARSAIGGATYLGYQFDLTNTGLRQYKSQVIIGGIVGGVSGVGDDTNDFATG